MRYKDELIRAMDYLTQDPRTIFLGQAVAYPGTGMSETLASVPKGRLVELPVMEETQLGMCAGIALAGFVPVSVFPRYNFLLLAASQLVNHLDKFREMGCPAKVIVRTSIGSTSPLHPGPQHTGDFTAALRHMLRDVEVVRLDDAAKIFDTYRRAYDRKDSRPTVVVEWADAYDPAWWGLSPENPDQSRREACSS